MKNKGFTLVELMITLAVLAILITLAGPSFLSTLERNRISSELSEFSASLRLARTEAVKRGRLVVVCPSSDQATCSGTWKDGWIVFEDTSASGAFVAATDEMIRINGALASGDTLEWSDAGSAAWGAGVASYIQYNSRGLITTNDGTFKLCGRSRNNQYARALVVGSVGSLRFGIDNDNNNIYEDEAGSDLSC